MISKSLTNRIQPQTPGFPIQGRTHFITTPDSIAEVESQGWLNGFLDMAVAATKRGVLPNELIDIGYDSVKECIRYVAVYTAASDSYLLVQCDMGAGPPES